MRVGRWVEIRSKDEILKTLDQDGRLDGMPFMPEMFAFCGKKFQVYKSAHKTCDTVFPVRGRRVHAAVHLDTRCDGSAHDGCQAGCLLFWKEAWLKPVDGHAAPPAKAEGATEADVFARAKCIDPATGTPRYECQATQLPYATTDLDPYDFGQYVEDYKSGNVGLWQLICGGVYSVCQSLTRRRYIGGILVRLYDKLYPLWGGTPYPRKNGFIPEGEPTPAQTLNLQPGELVRVKSYDEIRATLNTKNRNRGLFWDAEEVPYCGGTYRVLRRVDRIVNEKTGRMLEMKTPCVILDNVVCQSRFSDCRMFCPRSIYSYWREIWLERMETGGKN